MKNITEQYKDLCKGNLTESQFMRNVRGMFPKYITNFSSFQDTIKILKNKQLLHESDCGCYDPTQFNLGMRIELEQCDDEYKVEKIVMKNLSSNPSYYTDFQLSGFNKESMKKDRKKRTDLSIELKKDNFVDKQNGLKKIKDKLTEEEIYHLINKTLLEYKK